MHIIDMADGNRSGNSIFSARIKSAFQDEISVLPYDSCHLPYGDISLKERKHMNYDFPDALDFI